MIGARSLAKELDGAGLPAAPALTVDAVLAGCSLFSAIRSKALAQFRDRATLQPIRGGELLFAQGSKAEHLFIVAIGRLRAFDTEGQPVADFTRFEPVGEIALLSEEPRHLSVVAVRDSVLVRIDGAEWLKFIEAQPAALLAVTRVIIQRTQQNRRQSTLGHAQAAQTIAVLPAHPGLQVRGIVEALAEQLARLGPTRVVNAAQVDAAFGQGTAESPRVADVDGRVVGWLNELEGVSRNVVYCAEAGDALWLQRCLRQADRILLVADSRRAPGASPAFDWLGQLPSRAKIELLLLRPELAVSGDVNGWRLLTRSEGHYFVRPGHTDDIAALARQLSGRGIGLVLGGGGARGFAHIGLMRALEELRIPVDLVGGASMGALLGALLASGYDSHELRTLAHETFVARNYLNDYILPRVAMIRGRKFLQRLQQMFGDTRIEQLRMSYFCVSTNLTRACPHVHRDGSLAFSVGASMAVPGIVPPVVWNGDLLADGAVINSLPTDVMHALGRGPILASDVSSEGGPRLNDVEGPDAEAVLRLRPAGTSMFELLFRMASLTSDTALKARQTMSDAYLQIPVGDVSMFEWRRLDEIIDRSYRYALEALAPLRDKLLNPVAPIERLGEFHPISNDAVIDSR